MKAFSKLKIIGLLASIAVMFEVFAAPGIPGVCGLDCQERLKTSQEDREIFFKLLLEYGIISKSNQPPDDKSSFTIDRTRFCDRAKYEIEWTVPQYGMVTAHTERTFDVGTIGYFEWLLSRTSGDSENKLKARRYGVGFHMDDALTLALGLVRTKQVEQAKMVLKEAATFCNGDAPIENPRIDRDALWKYTPPATQQSDSNKPIPNESANPVK